MTTPIDFPTAPADDGDFSHPAFRNANYDVLQMAKDLYSDSGLEWPEWVDDPSKMQDQKATEENEGDGGDATQTPTTDKDLGDKTPSKEGVPSQTQTTTTPSTVVKLGDREIPIQQAEALAQWHDWLTNNPDKAETIVKIMKGEGAVPPPPTMTDPTKIPPTTTPTVQPPTVPEGFDLETPRDKFIFEQLNRIQQGQTQLAELARQQQERAQQEFWANKARIDTQEALGKFQSKYQLSEDEVNLVRQTAADLNLIGGLVARDPQHAQTQIVKALEASMWNVDKVREKLLNLSNNSKSQQTATTRQKKLNSLNPSGSGSAPRSESRPRLDSDYDMKEAIAKAIEPLWNSQ